MRKKLVSAILVGVMCLGLTGCDMAGFNSEVQDIKGSITGCTYDCKFYSNMGDNFMTVKGQKIDMNSNIVEESTYNSNDGWGTVQTVSSVVTITIDGHQIESCGSSVIFAQDDLKPDADFTNISEINSTAEDFKDNVWVANIVNEYKNYFGKPVIVVIQSQLGDPICAYSGQDVYWEVVEDLPKTTKLMIDGKALYIHRANFQIIDKSLLE